MKYFLMTLQDSLFELSDDEYYYYHYYLGGPP